MRWSLGSWGVTLLFLGFILIIVGMLLMFYHAWKEAKGAEVEEGRTEVKGGGIILIGPIPIVFGTDFGSLKFILVMAAILIIVLFIFLFFLPHILKSMLLSTVP